ncbi:phage head-tail connector protein [Gemmata sp. G18]|uniref:Phage head-tail connector protein n=1 Tax=Gemmata palustris TaxID=2822762 RepID=A0ABS5BMJ4_9BACT|nr:head-tail connector protein [Gemmata palustris]MBP3954917.1 phage head-tail connector protein [Gemmata palustris]
MHHYSLEIIEPGESISLVEALKAHIKSNNGTSEDSELQVFLDAAMSAFEHETDGRIVLSTTFKQYFPCWAKCLELARGKVTNVAAVSYFDENEDEFEIDGWYADFTSIPALVNFPDLAYFPDGVFPALSLTRPRPVCVEFTAGWVGVDYLPAEVRVAVLQLAAHYYANRESHTTDTLKELPMGFTRICNKYLTGLGGV